MNPNPPSTYHYVIRIYYEDTDAGGVAYHANYLRYAERARTEALREAGIPHAKLVTDHNLMFVVHRAEIDYMRPARLDDTLVIETRVTDVRGATVALRQTMRGSDGIRVVVRIKLACVQIGGQKPARIPPRWRGVLDSMRRDDDEDT
jgi:acyl-CoA thioester hydrolase